jgi:ABC-2 type transport system permease protein
VIREPLARILAIARKEFRHLRRDHLTGGMVLGVPLMMTLLFGYAINQDVRHLRAGVADLAGTQRSRLLVEDAQATQVIDVVERVESAEALESLLVSGRISVGLLIPADFEGRFAHGGRPTAQLLVDGGDPIVLGAARGLLALPIHDRFRRTAAAAPTFELRAFYNPERRSPVHIVPGLCGVVLTLTMVLFTSVAIVREKERGNLELLITRPIRTTELMIGKILPYVAIGFIQVTLILLLGSQLFDVPIRGSLVDLYLGAGAFVAATLTLGLLISTAAATHPHAADRPGHHPARRRPRGGAAGDRAPPALLRDPDGALDPALPQETGLSAPRRRWAGGRWIRQRHWSRVGGSGAAGGGGVPPPPPPPTGARAPRKVSPVLPGSPEGRATAPLAAGPLAAGRYSASSCGSACTLFASQPVSRWKEEDRNSARSS